MNNLKIFCTLTLIVTSFNLKSVRADVLCDGTQAGVKGHSYLITFYNSSLLEKDCLELRNFYDSEIYKWVESKEVYSLAFASCSPDAAPLEFEFWLEPKDEKSIETVERLVSDLKAKTILGQGLTFRKMTSGVSPVLIMVKTKNQQIPYYKEGIQKYPFSNFISFCNISLKERQIVEKASEAEFLKFMKGQVEPGDFTTFQNSLSTATKVYLTHYPNFKLESGENFQSHQGYYSARIYNNNDYRNSLLDDQRTSSKICGVHNNCI